MVKKSLDVFKGSILKIKGGDLCKDLCVKVGNEIYLMSHYNVADLSMIED